MNSIITADEQIRVYMKRRRLTIIQLSNRLVMSERTLRRKLSNPELFTLGEIQKIQDVLSIPQQERSYVIEKG